MKSGFKDSIDKIFKQRFFRTVGAVGLVISQEKEVYNYLKEKGYNVELNTDSPRYDFAYISYGKFSQDLLIDTIGKMRALGVIVVNIRDDEEMEKYIYYIAAASGDSVCERVWREGNKKLVVMWIGDFKNYGEQF